MQPLLCVDYSCLPSSARTDSVLACQIWQGKMPWLAQQLSDRGLKECRCRLLTEYEVYDETLADQFRVSLLH